MTGPTPDNGPDGHYRLSNWRLRELRDHSCKPVKSRVRHLTSQHRCHLFVPDSRGDDGKDFVHRGQIRLNILFRMCKGRVERFRRQVTALEHQLSEERMGRPLLFTCDFKMRQRIESPHMNVQTGSRGRILPSPFYRLTHPHQMVPNSEFPMLADRRERCGWTNTLGPVSTADETVLGGLHNVTTSDNGGHRIAVANRLREHRNVRDQVVK